MKRMQNSPTFHLSKRVDSLSHDIDSIKSGMADTGADIEKLNDENKKFEDKLLLLQQKNDVLKTKVFNLTVSLVKFMLFVNVCICHLLRNAYLGKIKYVKLCVISRRGLLSSWKLETSINLSLQVLTSSLW